MTALLQHETRQGLFDGDFCSSAKGVGWDNCREGSNPSFSAKSLENIEFSGLFSFCVQLSKVAKNVEKLSATNNITNNKLFALHGVCRLQHIGFIGVGV